MVRYRLCNVGLYWEIDQNRWLDIDYVMIVLYWEIDQNRWLDIDPVMIFVYWKLTRKEGLI